VYYPLLRKSLRVLLPNRRTAHAERQHQASRAPVIDR